MSTSHLYSSADGQQDSEAMSSDGSSPRPKKKRRFLDGYYTKPKGNEDDEVDRYLKEGTGSISQLDRYPSVKAIYR